MTQEDIIRMAREAGAVTGSPVPNAPEVIFTQCLDIRLFAALVAAAERDACAKIVESVSNHDNPMTAGDCAEAIRARGQA